jgi:hypothetical protein
MRSTRPCPARIRALSATALLFGLTGAALAEAPPIKPGLWEVHGEGQTLNGKPLPDMSSQMREHLKAMPPEARKQMEAQLKARGVQLAPDGSQGIRMCLTQEMLNQQHWQQTERRCQNTAFTHSGKVWRWQVKCTQPPSEGEGETTIESPERYVTHMRMTMQRDGRSQTMEMTHRGQWLGANCGDVQPMPLKPTQP